MEKTDWRLCRMQVGLTQKQASAELGIPASHLCKIEKGYVKPTAKTIKKMCELYNLDFAKVITEME